MVGLKKCFLKVIRIGKEDYLASAKSRAKGKRENLQQRREMLGEDKKKDKALLRISTLKKDQGRRRMPAGSG